MRPSLRTLAGMTAAAGTIALGGIALAGTASAETPTLPAEPAPGIAYVMPAEISELTIGDPIIINTDEDPYTVPAEISDLVLRDVEQSLNPALVDDRGPAEWFDGDDCPACGMG